MHSIQQIIMIITATIFINSTIILRLDGFGLLDEVLCGRGKIRDKGTHLMVWLDWVKARSSQLLREHSVFVN